MPRAVLTISSRDIGDLAELADGSLTSSVSAISRGRFNIRATARLALIFACFDSRTWSSASSSFARTARTSASRIEPRLEELLVADQELADPLDVDLAELHGQGRGDRVHIDRVEVVDLVTDGVLELGLGHALGDLVLLGARHAV